MNDCSVSKNFHTLDTTEMWTTSKLICQRIRTIMSQQGALPKLSLSQECNILLPSLAERGSKTTNSVCEDCND